ncbi:hypothetical protein QNN81_16310, partial [Listeria monocytogenes]|nr:hypothetical protein [Listeria monocytogenes]
RDAALSRGLGDVYKRQEHMSRIRQQRQRAGEYPAHHLKEHKSGSDDKGEKQATSIIIFRQV